MKSLERACAALLIASAVGGASCISGPEAVGRVAEPIIGGDADVSDVAVVALQQTSTGTLCSGTLIAPTIVLTAAHCVYGVSPSDMQVLVGNDVSSPTQTVAASSLVAYPTYTGESSGLPGGVDLGVVVLAQSLSITPVGLDTTSTDAELANATVTLVGFGVSSTLDDDQVGVRMSVSTPITDVCSRMLTLGSASANECFGDSGGAVLLNGKLVAVISSGLADCTAPSNQMRLSAHANWLADVLAGSPSASCPTCVPPDPSCGAATETAPATSDDAGAEDAASGGEPDAATSDSKGGCTMTPRRPQGGEGFALFLLSLALVRRARRRS